MATKKTKTKKANNKKKKILLATLIPITTLAVAAAVTVPLVMYFNKNESTITINGADYDKSASKIEVNKESTIVLKAKSGTKITGIKKITVNGKELIENKEFTFNSATNTITIKAEAMTSTKIEIEVKSEPTPAVKTLTSITLSGTYKTTYTVGDKLDLTGLVVTAHYAEGGDQQVTNYTTNPSKEKTLTKQDTQVTVSYTEGGITKTASYNITVTDPVVIKTLTSISLSGTYKTTYTVGDKLDLSNLVVTAHYAQGGDQQVTNYTTDPSTSKELAESDKKVTVSYTEGDVTKTAEYTITVSPKAYTKSTIIDSDGKEYTTNMDTLCTQSGDIKGADGGGNEKTWPRSTFNCQIIIGTEETEIKDYFLCGCASFDQQLTIPNNITKICDGFLEGCTSFNQPLTIPGSVKTIGATFMLSCDDFNKTLIIEDGVKEIGNSFLSGCFEFNNGADEGQTDKPFVVPNSIVSIGDYFMDACKAFNQKITLSNNTEFTEIKQSFLQNCESFNQKIELPNNITEIGGSFLTGCSVYNQVIEINSNITKIGGSFLSGCQAFNQEIIIPNSVTNIGSRFLAGCVAFNNGADEGKTDKPFAIPDSVESLGEYFLHECTKFNQTVTIPSNENLDCLPAYFLKKCESFNQPIKIPNNIEYTDKDILSGCISFNNTIDLSAIDPVECEFEFFDGGLLKDVPDENIITFKVANGKKDAWTGIIEAGIEKLLPTTWTIVEV